MDTKRPSPGIEQENDKINVAGREEPLSYSPVSGAVKPVPATPIYDDLGICEDHGILGCDMCRKAAPPPLVPALTNLGALLRRAIDEGLVDRIVAAQAGGTQMDRAWWRSQGIEACLDRISLIAGQHSAALARERALRDELAAAKNAHENARKEWYHAEGLLKATRNDTAPASAAQRDAKS